jgi:DNA repair protein RadA/Sms
MEPMCLVIVDSVQTIASAEVDGRAGGVTQVMEVASALTRVAKSRGLPICLVGQVTKESVVAGPSALEHIADATLSLDGDRHSEPAPAARGEEPLWAR